MDKIKCELTSSGSGTKFKLVGTDTGDVERCLKSIVHLQRKMSSDTSDWYSLEYDRSGTPFILSPQSVDDTREFLINNFDGEFDDSLIMDNYIVNCHKVSTQLVDSLINVLITDQDSVVSQWMPSIVSSLKMECGTKLKNRPTREYLHSINTNSGVIDSEKLEDRVDGLMAMLPIKDRNIKITYGKCRLAIESLIYNISNSRSYSPSRLQELVQDWYKFINSTLNL